MRILFTKLRHIGDNLLITPIIVATRQKFPEAEIWVAVRRGTEGILAGCPEIDRLLTTARPEEGRRTWRDSGSDFATLAGIAAGRFDFAMELGDNDRGRTLIAASMARVRATHASDLGLSPFWRRCFTHVVEQERGNLHQVEMDYMTPRMVLGLPDDIPPLRFAREASLPWKGDSSLPRGGFAILHAATRWHCKSWPSERWRAALEGILEFTPRVIVSCGPSPDEIAEARGGRPPSRWPQDLKCWPGSFLPPSLEGVASQGRGNYPAFCSAAGASVVPEPLVSNLAFFFSSFLRFFSISFLRFSNP